MLWQTGSSWSVMRLLWPIVVKLCIVLEGAHRMELSGELVLGLQPVGRKSEAAVQCYSEWPLRVQCDGQSGASHTGSLYPGFLDSLSFLFFFCFSHNVTHRHTSFFFFFNHTSIFFSVSSWSQCGKSSFCCKAGHCEHKQFLTCAFFFFLLSVFHSLSPYFSHIAYCSKEMDNHVLEVVGCLNGSISQGLGACESHQRKRVQCDFHLRCSTHSMPAGSIFYKAVV